MTRHPSSQTRALRIMLTAATAIAGATALVFENLWFRQTGLVFGNSVWASSLVLAAFMGGLGLGNGIAMRFGDTIPRTLRVYAAIECVVALTGLALVYSLPIIGIALVRALPEALPVPALQAARLISAFVLLLVPSTGMGITLPLLTRALTNSDQGFGKALGQLYAANTLGAAAGALLTETVLVPALGIRGTGWVAGAVGCGVAGTVALIPLRLQTVIPQREQAPENPTRQVRPWIIAAFVGGFAVLALEVVWFRFLLLYVFGRPTTFSVMLGAVLLGVALGGWYAGRALRIDAGAHRYAWLFSLSAGALTLISYTLFPRALAAFTSNGKAQDLVDVAQLSGPLIVPVCFASGAFFTLVGAALQKGIRESAATVGAVTLANTAGAAAGSLTAGFVLLPLVGMEASLFSLGALLLVNGAALWWVSARDMRRGVLSLGLAIAAIVTFPFGAMTRFHIPVRQQWYGGDIIGVREGLSDTLVYTRESFHDETTSVRLITNSHSMAGSDFHARRYMKLFTWLPAALKSDIHSALLISFGCGQTARSLVDTPEIRRIDVVDISGEVLDMNHLVFPNPKDQPLLDSRVHIHIEDGRYFLTTTRQRFDLITSEPPPPTAAGVVNLYTREYFRLAHDALAEGGLVSYWLPIHDLSDRSALAILRGFCDVFPDCSLWRGQATSLMMLGSKRFQGQADRARFERLWHRRPDADDLRAVGFEEPAQLGALFLGDRAYLQDLIAGTTALHDDDPAVIHVGFDGPPPANKPTVGQAAARSALFDSWTRAGKAALERWKQSQLARGLFPPEVAARADSLFWVQDAIDDLESGRKLAPETVIRLLTTTTLRYPILIWAGTSPDEIAAARRLRALGIDAPDVHYALAIDALASRDGARARESLARAGGRAFEQHAANVEQVIEALAHP